MTPWSPAGPVGAISEEMVTQERRGALIPCSAGRSVRGQDFRFHANRTLGKGAGRAFTPTRRRRGGGDGLPGSLLRRSADG